MTHQGKSFGSALTIRPVRPQDAPDLYEAARLPQVAHFISLLPSLELSETEAYINEGERGRHFLVAEVAGKAVGSATLNQATRPRLTHSGVLGIMVHPAYWQRGIGTALMRAILEVADNWLDLKRVELSVASTNTVAVHLYEQFGFQDEGLRRHYAYGSGQWMDSHVMARLYNLPKQATAATPEKTTKASLPRQQRLEIDVRPPRREDAEAMYEIMRHPAVARTTLQMPTQEIGRIRRRLEETRPDLHRFVATTDDRVVGITTVHRPRNPRRTHAAGLGMSVHPDYWNRGVGSALLTTVIDLADNWLNLERLELEVNVDNPGGIHLYRKFGFVTEGTRRFHAYGDGRWADSHFMARLRTQDAGEGRET
jgi:putative acetyltransferase